MAVLNLPIHHRDEGYGAVRPAPGRSLELYFINGRPDGMVTARTFGWNGQLLVVPRTQLAYAFSRPEARYSGIYILLGETDEGPAAYIGESEDIGVRLKTHDVEKDFWSTVVMVTTSGNELNKAHVRYLEARLIQEARRIGRTPLVNGTAPPRPGLSEADIGKMEAFLEVLFFVLPAVRVDIFIERARPLVTNAGPSMAVEQSPRFVLSNRKHGLRATAVVADGEFVVEAGSTARAAWEGALPQAGYARLHAELRRAEVLVLDGGHCRFAENYAFKSPSAAAAVINGRPANGAVEWRTDQGESFKAWEQRSLSADTVQARPNSVSTEASR
jgi:hypothetical protein